MKEEYQRDLESSFIYGYGCCVFKHDICGDQPKIPNCMPKSSKFFLLSALQALGAPLSRHPLKTAVGVHRIEVAEALERGALVEHLNGAS